MIDSGPKELQSRIKGFAGQDSIARAYSLPDLIRYVNHKNKASHEIVRSLVNPETEYADLLQSAIRTTLNTQFLIDRQPVNLWEGSPHVTVLDQSGDLVYAQHSSIGRIYDQDGPNRYPQALTQALLGLQLYQTDRYLGSDEHDPTQIGLSDPDNRRYLEDIGVPENDINLGESIILEGAELNVGTSGCGFRRDILETLLPVDMRDCLKLSFLEGFANNKFATLIAAYFQDRQSVAKLPEALPIFDFLRNVHFR